MTPLPELMVAPNGARKTKTDHPAIPINLDEIIATAVACFGAGADGLHLHMRDSDGHHTLDAGLYREALQALNQAVPDMFCQITTEAVGQYSAADQQKIVEQVQPKCVSISLAEMLTDGDILQVCQFYDWCRQYGIAVQHILYDDWDLHVMSGLIEHGLIATDCLQVLFVLGRYDSNQQSRREDMDIYQSWLGKLDFAPDWAVCAFGKKETECLAHAARLGGKVRVGFENSFWNADGTRANSNSERVAELKAVIDRQNKP